MKPGVWGKLSLIPLYLRLERKVDRRQKEWRATAASITYPPLIHDWESSASSEDCIIYTWLLQKSARLWLQLILTKCWQMEREEILYKMAHRFVFVLPVSSAAAVISQMDLAKLLKSSREPQWRASRDLELLLAWENDQSEQLQDHLTSLSSVISNFIKVVFSFEYVGPRAPPQQTRPRQGLHAGLTDGRSQPERVSSSSPLLHCFSLMQSLSARCFGAYGCAALWISIRSLDWLVGGRWGWLRAAEGYVLNFLHLH